jgi:hypothetical protein
MIAYQLRLLQYGGLLPQIDSEDEPRTTNEALSVSAVPLMEETRACRFECHFGRKVFVSTDH